MSRSKFVLTAIAFSILFFLLLPIRSEKLYKCESDPSDLFSECLDLYSSHERRSFGLTLLGALSDDYELDDNSRSDAFRNVPIAAVLGFVSSYVFYRVRRRKSRDSGGK